MAAVLQEVDEADLINVVLVRCSGGVCLRGHLSTSARTVALKLLSTDSCLSRMQEVLAQTEVCMERVLQPVGVYRSGFLTALLWDWMPEGSLHSLLYETGLYPDLPLNLRLRILLEVAEGLNVLHSVSLPHAALKTTNVLLDHQYHAKLCDWGGEALVPVRSRIPNAAAVCFRDLACVAPEVVLGKVPCVKSDVYSFAILMWETLNRPPAGGGLDQLQNLLVCAQKGAESATERNLLPAETPQSHALSRLISRCWSVDPNLRPSAEECVLELRKVLEGLDPGAVCRAVHQIKAGKERALLSCEHTPDWELPIELNNLEGFGGCTDPKHLKSKSVPVPVAASHTPRSPSRKPGETSRRGSPGPAGARAAPPVVCCGDVRNSAARDSPPAYAPCGSPTPTPTPPTHTPLHHANQTVCPVSSGWTCCRLLQERRELIVRFMTEGRLNNLLDVLRARRAVTPEHYEVITAAMTLSARTRRLLDTCACLGEKAAILVATTLGLVSMETAQGHAHSRISPEGKAG